MDFGKLLRRKSFLVGASAIAVITVVALPLANAAITAKPGSFGVSCSTGSCTLHWNAVSGATGYVVAYGMTSGSQANKIATTKTSLTVGNLNANTKYYWEVWATPTGPGGPHSGPILGQTKGASSYAANPPTGFKATAGTNYSAQLSWNKVAGATSYTIAYGTTSGAQTYRTSVGANTTHTAIQPLNSNTTYYFEVWANPTKAGGAHAGPIGVKISNDPTVGSSGPWVTQAPSNLHVIAVGSDFIQVGWNSVPNATSYSVNYSTTSSFQRNTNVCVVVGNSAIFDTYNVGGAYGTTARLQPNTTYNIQLWGNPIQVDASPHASLSVKTAAAGSSATEPHGQCGSGGSTPTSSTSSSSSSSSGGFVGDAPSPPTTTASTTSSSSSTSSGSSGTFVNDFGMTVSAPNCAQIQAFFAGYPC